MAKLTKLQSKAVTKWSLFAMQYQDMPIFAKCKIRFVDEAEHKNAIISIGIDVKDTILDKNVFFSCKDEIDFINLCDDFTDEDFVIIDIIDFSNDINELI